VFAAYVTVTLATSAVVGLAAIGNLAGHPYVKGQADANRVPQSWRLPLGMLLAAGALGLLAGFAVPLLGTAAAVGLVLYFVGAFGAHLRARNYRFGPWSLYFTMAVATLVLNIAYNDLW
jgi:hypothetical protein